MAAKRKSTGQHAVTTTDAARWQLCPFAGALDAVEAAIKSYRGFVNDIGHDCAGSVIALPIMRLYDALDRAADAIGNSPNPSQEIWPGCRTVDDVSCAIDDQIASRLNADQV